MNGNYKSKSKYSEHLMLIRSNKILQNGNVYGLICNYDTNIIIYEIQKGLETVINLII